jgi:hypothetical protein
MKVNKIDWKNHLIELIVVFIGITLAFMLNNWREHTKDKKLESQYLSSFYEEIVFANGKLDTIINTNKEKMTYLARMIESLQKDILPVDSTIAVIAQMAQISLFIPKVNTYESIKNSGNFNLIDDYDIRSKLIEYYESFEGKKLVEDYYKMYINNYLIPYFFEHVDILNARIINRKEIESFKLNNLIVGYYQLLAQVVDNYKNIHKLNKHLIAVLEKEHLSL